MYNLTEEQKDSLRWIIKKIRSGELGETFNCVLFTTGNVSRFQGKGENISTEEIPLTNGILQSLKASDMIFIEELEKTMWRCGLLGDKAYKAVDSNFAETNIILVGERKIIYSIIISLIFLSFTLVVFIMTSPIYIALWLFFLIVAYPLVLAYTTAQQSMDNRELIQMYKIGINQIPNLFRFIWKWFSSW